MIFWVPENILAPPTLSSTSLTGINTSVIIIKYMANCLPNAFQSMFLNVFITLSFIYFLHHSILYEFALSCNPNLGCLYWACFHLFPCFSLQTLSSEAVDNYPQPQNSNRLKVPIIHHKNSTIPQTIYSPAFH